MQTAAANIIPFPFSRYMQDQKEHELPTAEQAFDVVTSLPTNEIEKLHKMLKEHWIVRPQQKRNEKQKKGA